MKKTIRSIVVALFSLSLLCALAVQVFAIGAMKAVKATATYNSVTLTWSKVSGADGYQVEIYQNKKWVKIADTKSTSYKHTKRKLGTTYKYRVRAYDKKLFNRYDYTSYKTASAKTALAKPTGLKATASNPTKITLSWKKVSGAATYTVQRKNGSKWVNVKTKLKAVKYTISGLKLGNSYKYRVIAVNGKNSSPASAAVSYKATYAKPTSFKASSVTPTTATLSWKKVTSASNYRIEVYTSGKWKTLKNLTAVSYKVTGLTPGSTYKYRVYAYKGSVKGNVSSTVTVKPTVAAPTSLKVTAATANSVSISFTKAKNVTGTSVEIYKGGKWVAANTTNANYVFSSLTVGTDYNIRIRSYVTANKKNYYSAYTSQVAARTAPAQVSSLEVTDVQDVSVTLEWKASAGAGGYQIQTLNSEGAVVKTNTTKSTAYKVTGLSPSTNYSFAVSAYHSVGVKTTSEASIAAATTYYDTVDSLVLNSYADSPSIFQLVWTSVANSTYVLERYYPDADEWRRYPNSDSNLTNVSQMYSAAAKEGFTVTASTSNYETTLNWTAQAGCGKYDVQVRSGSSDEWRTLATTSGTSTKVILAPGTTHQIRVLAYNGAWRVYAVENSTGVRTAARTVSSTPDSFSQPLNCETPAASAYANNNLSKTAYALKLVQAINDTKAYKGDMSVRYVVNMSANLTDANIDGHDLNWLLFMFPNLKEELTQSMNENTDVTYSFSNGTARYTGSDGLQRTLSLDTLVSPTNKDAYLYNQSDAASVSSRLSAISVSTSGTKTTISLTLPVESSDGSKPTNVHDGFMDSMASELSSGGMGDDAKGSVTVGKTTVTGVINQDGMLYSLVINSPFTMVVSGNMSTDDGDKIAMSMTMKGTSKYQYTFTR